MSQEQKQNETEGLSRRRALKVIGVGVGAASALPVLQPTNARGQHHHGHPPAPAASTAKPAAPRFFTPAEMATITAISELIIPTDDHSPGAKEAQVASFIDLMISETPQETKQMWRSGLAAINRMSTVKFSKPFAGVSEAQQDAIMAEISRNELEPKTPEEKFFKAVKNLTIDGYYTSEIGIHKDLVYQGNSYVKEYTGCTHPEHKA